MATEVTKQGRKYVVYNHVLNLTIPFRNKADADELADKLNNPPSAEVEETQTE